eukprot:m51a1_g8834 hypothetical protein (347) ;mRNA; f:402120-403368
MHFAFSASCHSDPRFWAARRAPRCPCPRPPIFPRNPVENCHQKQQQQQQQGHRYRTSAALREALEGQRPAYPWAPVRGVREANDRLLACGLVARPPPAELVRCPADAATAAAATATRPQRQRHGETERPGGRYASGGRAQEEDLCRLLPQLHASLVAAAAYPLAPGDALLSRSLLALRAPGTYELCPALRGARGDPLAARGPVGHAGSASASAAGALGEACGARGVCEALGVREVDVVSAAMPCGAADRRPRGGWRGSPWWAAATLSVRAALHAMAVSGRDNAVLGAFGCGAFGNPAGPVAQVFREQLLSPEFRGAFRRVVFAILDPLGTGNIGPFRRELAGIDDE